MPSRNYIILYVNGVRRKVKADPTTTLLNYLRNDLALTGTKLGCGEGGCGACTVNVTRFEPDFSNGGSGKRIVRHRSLNACLVPLCSMDGAHVTTIEGIGNRKQPHPVQQRLAEMHGSQCGFCTPGIVMALYSKLQEHPTPTVTEIEETFDGNLCRCTGYRPILDAAKTFATTESCAAECAAPQRADYGSAKVKVSNTFTKLLQERDHADDLKRAAEAHKPPRLSSECASLIDDPLEIKGADGSVWARPTNLDELLQIKYEYPGAKLVGGNTEVGIDVKFKHMKFNMFVSTLGVDELHSFKLASNGTLIVGGGISLSQLLEFMRDATPKLPAHATGNFDAIIRMCRWFASHQIRNAATLAGNICNASPIADLGPILLAAGSNLTFRSLTRDRDISILQFFTGYRKTAMDPTEVLVGVEVPATRVGEVVEVYKQARRREDDISIVSAAFRALVDRSGSSTGELVIKEMFTGFGGMAAVTINSASLEKAFVGLPLTLSADEVMRRAQEAILADFPMTPTTPGGMPAYRQTLAASFATKFYALLQERFGQATKTDLCTSQARTFLNSPQPVTTGEQAYKPREEAAGGIIGAEVAHRAALLQCTGEAKYVDDIPSPAGTLHAAVVLSTQPTGNIERIDLDEALSIAGVHSIYTAKDIGDVENRYSITIHNDEELFRRDRVTSTGQILGVVLADNHETARKAALKVKVVYSQQTEPVITINQAIEKKAFHKTVHFIDDGSASAAMKAAEARDDVVFVEGDIRMGGQEHFYLETNATLAIPTEADELEIHSSTQNPNLTQKVIAGVCGIKANQVAVHMKRMGGGFGGKETRTVLTSAVAAFAARKSSRPVRILLEREDDMWITGTRHPFMGKYKVAATKDGQLLAVDTTLYSNAGYSSDLSESVMDRALFHSDNAYRVPALRAYGYLCMTNTASNTAFRGFGGPQGMFVVEQWMEHLAHKLNMDVNALREKNFYQEGDRTHYLQELSDNRMQRIWSSIMQTSEFSRRAAEIEEFNGKSRWQKRGIAAVPTKFGISFTAKFLNQGMAMVHIYLDGTVLVTHGGNEMGQGIHTKVIQVVANELGIPVADVHITETSTDKIPNASPSAASTCFDMYGAAAKAACDELNARLAPFRKAPGVTFRQAVNAAYMNMVPLSAQGFFKGNTGYDWTKPHAERGTPFNYFTYGAAVSEVQVDTLTGDVRVLRTDVTMDLGNSMNPAIDIGQIEGAVVQGLGWCMIEECVWGGDEHKWLRPGVCLTRGPGTYKLPSFNDVPIDLRVSLLPDAPNSRAVYSSKAVGEPPFFVATSAFFATRNAIKSARKQNGLTDFFVVDSPLTPERVRMACGDFIATENHAKQQVLGAPPRPALFC